MALYDFQAVEPTDLDLRAGDRILVTESINEWWKGTCNGRSGIFPANYVQKCSPLSGDVLQLGKIYCSRKCCSHIFPFRVRLVFSILMQMN